MAKKYGYARVSTKAQAMDGNSLEAQEAALREAGAEVIYKDSFTGKVMSRPEFERLLSILEPGDTIIVSKLDRFARSIGQASELITRLIDSGITIQVLDLGTLSNNSVSTLLRNVLLSFAQFERDMIVQRTQEGKAVARTKAGYREGRPPKYTKGLLDAAMRELEDHSYAQVSDIYKISISTLKRERRKRREDAAAAAIAWEPTAETAEGAQFSMDDYENIRKG